MKSEVNDSSNQKYPRLYKDNSSEMIVLFTGEQSGIVVYGGGGWHIGEIYDHWTSCYDTNGWLPFHGSVTLSND